MMKLKKLKLGVDKQSPQWYNNYRKKEREVLDYDERYQIRNDLPILWSRPPR